MQIRIIVTGGTFDKEYNELNGQLFFKETHLQTMLGLGRCLLKVSVDIPMLIDSLDMTDADRELIANEIGKCTEERLVITHGTDTMTDTAAYIAAKNMVKLLY